MQANRCRTGAHPYKVSPSDLKLSAKARRGSTLSRLSSHTRNLHKYVESRPADYLKDLKEERARKTKEKKRI